MRYAFLASTALAAIAAPAFAQTADPAAGPSTVPAPVTPATPAAGVSDASSEAAGIGEIVVTARQRAESLQDVPVAVSALGGALLENAQIQNVDAIERYIPNVELGRHPFTGGGLSASIRGVSFGDLDRAFEPAVAVAVDGVFLASNTGAMTDAFDVAQIEVLRGPQGTLFGRNTIGGVINIKRTKPTLDWGAKLQGTYGSYDRREVRGILNAPIVKDVLGVKLGGYYERSDSFTRRLSDGKREDGIDRVSLFGAIRYAPDDSFDATLSVDYIDDKSHYPSLVPLSAGPGLVPASNNQLFCSAFRACYGTQYQQIKNSGFKAALNDYPFAASLESIATALNMKKQFGGLSIESITGYMHQKDALNIENTGGANFLPGRPIFVSMRDQKAEQISQELRAISSFDGAFNFVAGLYYMRSTFDLNPQIALLNGTPSQNFSAGQALDAYAAYAEGYLDLAKGLRLTVGGRYTIEKKAFHITFRNPATGAVTARCPDASLTANPAFDSCRDPDVTFKKFTPRIILDYHFTPDVMIYGSWSRGYRSGGWNSRASVITAIGPYEPETVDSYEAGIRTTLIERRLHLNLTGFHTKYKNKQEEVITASPVNPAVTQTLVENAGKATINGGELELDLAMTDWLRIRGSAGYLDAKYDSFIQGGVDIRALRNLRYAPEWSTSIGGEATIPIGDNTLLANANYKWTDKFATAIVKDTLGLNRDFIDNYGTFDASIGYELSVGARSKAKLSVFAQNAFHKDGRLYRKVITGPFSFGSREVGRTFGVELGFTY
ncbi:TonB-dependent receptor [Sphingomonas profundi]|uniref:TonB-dependent receptor n=1 Tax=Alterirhizorhabdus profundi TaxID=2681549 RepID=UPI0018D1AC2A|nr:TonB-dependent receptor [Sphingomonas profundi]